MLGIYDYLIIGIGILIAGFLIINMIRETFLKK